MKIPAFLFLFAFAATCLLPAQDAELDPAAVEAAKSLIVTMGMETIMSESLEAGLGAQLEPMKQLGLGPEGMKELEVEMLAFLKEVMSWESLEPEFVKLYAEAFTVDELRELNAFYQSPTGKKAASLSPQLMAEGMKLGQNAVQSRMPELQQRITPIIQKHLGQ